MTAVARNVVFPTDQLAALQFLPRVSILHTVGMHTLFIVSATWLILLGPDDMTNLSWVEDFLPGARDWTATFETFGRTLLTHFTRS